MKAYQIGDQQGLASLTLVDKPSPVCGYGQALLKVSAVCLNHRDLKILSGEYGPRKREDLIPCADGVGVVIAVGEGVTNVKVGDRASCTHFVNWVDGAFASSIFGADLGGSMNGWLAEEIVVPAAALVKIPDALSDEQVAPLPAAGVTAWNTVVELGRVKAGDLVLALGTGGVSIFALQIAKMNGAQVAITSSSDEKLEKVRAMGADFTVHYKKRPDWAAALLEQTGQRGADIIVETGGGATLIQSIAAAAPNARIGMIGSLSGGFSGDINIGAAIGKNLVLKGMVVGSRRMFEDMLKAYAISNLTPLIDRVFPFAEAPAAYEYLKAGEHLGKIMIKL
jgi:NADPH:quinone reductase-like Zn-dependent oxidoreductase